MGGITTNRALFNGKTIQFVPSGAAALPGTSRPFLVGGKIEISASNNNNNCLSPPNLILAEPKGIGGVFVSSGIGEFTVGEVTDNLDAFFENPTLPPAFQVGFGGSTFEVYPKGVSEMIVGATGSLGAAFEIDLREYTQTSSLWYSLVKDGIGPSMVGYANIASTASSVNSFAVGDPDYCPPNNTKTFDYIRNPGTYTYDDINVYVNTPYWVYGLNKRMIVGYYTTESVTVITGSSGAMQTFAHRRTSQPLVNTASISESFNGFPVPSGSSLIWHYLPIAIKDGDSGSEIASASIIAINNSSIGPNANNFISASSDTDDDFKFEIYDQLGGTSQLDTRKYGTAFMAIDFTNGIGDAIIESGFQVEEDTRHRYDSYEVHYPSDGISQMGVGTLSNGIAGAGIGYTTVADTFIVGFETGDGAVIGETFEVGETDEPFGIFIVGQGAYSVHYDIYDPSYNEIGTGPIFNTTGFCLSPITESSFSSSGVAGAGYFQGIPSQSGVAMEMGFEAIGSNSFIFTGSNNASMYFSGSGNIGVGTTNPKSGFDVKADDFKIRSLDGKRELKFDGDGRLSTKLFASSSAEESLGGTLLLTYSPGTFEKPTQAQTDDIIGTILFVDESLNTVEKFQGSGAAAKITSTVRGSSPLGGGGIIGDLEFKLNLDTSTDSDVLPFLSMGAHLALNNNFAVHFPYAVSMSSNLLVDGYISSSDIRGVTSGKVTTTDTGDDNDYYFPILATTAVGDSPFQTDAGLSYNALTNYLSADFLGSGDGWVKGTFFTGSEVRATGAAGHITASNNISSSGTIYAHQISIDGVGVAQASVHKDFVIGPALSVNGDLGVTNIIGSSLVSAPQININPVGVGDAVVGIDLLVGAGFFDGDINVSGKLTSGNISSSGTVQALALDFQQITASILSGGAVGDQSGSLTISGSLTFRANEALPAISASTLYATGSSGQGTNTSDLHFEGMPIGPYHTVMINSGWQGGTTNKVWVPFAEGGLTDLSVSSTTTEYHSIIMPFDGYVDQVLVRSENDCGNVIVGTHIQVNGTESPSTTAGESITIDMGTDDTVQKFSFVDSAFAAGNIVAISFDPVSVSGDSIATLVLKYDMSKGYTNP